ncbi:MAG: hypothetical protein LUE27_11300 [Clostridia bacterium]|nr:hypothetical protein [Clostridia bacterium]
MATSSIFAPFVLDKDTKKILAEKLKEFEEAEIPDDALAAPSPCATPEELDELFKNAKIYDPDTGGFISLDTIDSSDSDDDNDDPDKE